jgi:hypothetical protein
LTPHADNREGVLVEEFTVTPQLKAEVPVKRWRGLRWIPLAIWFVATASVLSALAIGHWFTLPHPDREDARLTTGIRALAGDADGWAMVHVLYTECRCSQRIFDHLVDGARPADVRETVVLVGDDHGVAARLAARGYRVVPVAAEALAARYGIEGVPLLVVLDPAHHIRYSGGYTTRLQGPDIQDVAIVRGLQATGVAVPLPVYGCATSRRLQRLADPLAIKR